MANAQRSFGFRFHLVLFCLFFFLAFTDAAGSVRLRGALRGHVDVPREGPVRFAAAQRRRPQLGPRRRRPRDARLRPVQLFGAGRLRSRPGRPCCRLVPLSRSSCRGAGRSCDEPWKRTWSYGSRTLATAALVVDESQSIPQMCDRGFVAVRKQELGHIDAALQRLRSGNERSAAKHRLVVDELLELRRLIDARLDRLAEQHLYELTSLVGPQRRLLFFSFFFVLPLLSYLLTSLSCDRWMDRC